MDEKIRNLRDALEWVLNDIQEEAASDGEMSTRDAIRAGFIITMLAKYPTLNKMYYEDKETALKDYMQEQGDLAHGESPSDVLWALPNYYIANFLDWLFDAP